jgi:hypothetical protein
LSHHNLRQVSLKSSTYERLRRYGNTPDTFDEIVNRILDVVQEQKQLQEQQQTKQQQQQRKIAMEATLSK